MIVWEEKENEAIRMWNAECVVDRMEFYNIYVNVKKQN